jgi:hypothetical protein
MTFEHHEHMHTTIALAAAVLVAALLSGCGGGSDEPATSKDSPASVVERYVAAVAEKDFDGAMALRCPDARVPKSRSALWKDQLDLFVKANRRIGKADATSTSRTGMTPTEDLPGIEEVTYSVDVGGRTYAGLLAATVDDHGKRVVCGTATTKTKQLAREIGSASTANPATRSSPRTLVDVEPPEGYRQVEDQELAATDPQPGQQEGWTRALQTGSYGGARVTAVRFDSAQHASDAMHHHLTKSIGDTTEIFEVPKPDAIGVRVLAFAWLGIQPPDLGPYVDYVYSTFDDVLVTVAVANLPTGADHSVVERLAGAIAEHATSGS